MRDFATSDSPRVQAQLDRLGALSVPDGRFGLETIRALLARLDDPHLRLPPVFHVAGTNGKGSTCAFLRAMLEAEGYKVHATISPHLVRYNERIRLAGQLIDDDRLADLLAEVLDLGDDLNPSFFEVTIAAAFAEFARVPADVCVVEVGLGGRFDATNALEQPAVCGIAALGLDHERFLLAPEEDVPTVPLERIAFEKAGIAKPGVQLVTQQYDLGMTKAVLDQAMRAGARPALRGLDWFAEVGTEIAYRDKHGELILPLPALTGPHQADNAALAVAMIRHQNALAVSEAAIRTGLASARWPARLQRLSVGPLVGNREVWLDGGHNPSAGAALAQHFQGQRFHLIIGMLANKDPAALTGPLAANAASIAAVPVPTHEWHPAEAFGPNAVAFPDVPSALAAVPQDGLPVLIAGSLYLAGEVLRLNGELPD
ncbi:bifunctional folylpolyglutamate synthase/dihydrofolate synthase [Novosphingobium ginsenosidimutans]|uniref:Bifunctional folylpolyglutamate synthase/dihydrofolate synthase n=1 Tax=Novosphingobium ginsenosidimutans TaxID=1176536 RepID=A0A5B8S0E9_9SPHN|nr:folylpolyglutamate synthase/dihydrofolate synthase family protein [Novosphingobium ginsenosidimutans]QEA14658.1 bifunctional folylpolyglutamate synthase/dihydrofolate synthase [Novosphingobium ginsenosidimutans]